jgi:hypothetical protein
VVLVVRGEEPEVHADHAVAPLAHHQRGHRTVDPAAHGDNDRLPGAVGGTNLVFGEQGAGSRDVVGGGLGEGEGTGWRRGRVSHGHCLQ